MFPSKSHIPDIKKNALVQKVYSNTGLAALTIFFLILVLATSNSIFDSFNLEESEQGGGSYSSEEVAKITESWSMPEVVPNRLVIPKLKIDTTFSEPLGLLDNGEIAVPTNQNQVGWYKYGPVPGQNGPAVVIGHVDSKSGPAVFYSLGQLQPGDTLSIFLSDGSEKRYVVDYYERYEQADFPTTKVYSDLDYPGLRLITCSGKYERGRQRYTHNLVVFARLI